GDEHPWFKSESFAQTVGEGGHVGRCSSNYKRIRQCRAAKDCFTCMQRDEHAARHEARVLRERRCFDGAWRCIAQLKSLDDANYGQVQIFAVCLADRKNLAKINTKRSSRRLIEHCDGTVVRSQKATSGQREATYLAFRDRINSENVEVQESLVRNHIT